MSAPTKKRSGRDDSADRWFVRHQGWVGYTILRRRTMDGATLRLIAYREWCERVSGQRGVNHIPDRFDDGGNADTC